MPSIPTMPTTEEIELVESFFEMQGLDKTAWEGNPGLDVETKAIMEVIFAEQREVRVADYCGADADEE